MAAFAASFLANPFEAQLSSTGTTTDAMGNIFNANGQHIGVMSGSQADIGSAGTMVSPIGTTAAAAGGGATGGSVVPPSSGPPAGAPFSLWDKLGSLLTPSTSFGVGLVENGVFIVIGLLLIGAGVLYFSFQTGETVINKASSTAGRVSSVAEKASKLAELAA